LERLRHTGAGVLLRSRAVRDDEAAARNVLHVRVDIVGRDADRVWNLHLGLVPGIFGPRVEEDHRFAAVDAPSHLVCGNSLGFHAALHPCADTSTSLSSMIGSSRTRMPVACQTALAIAAATVAETHALGRHIEYVGRNLLAKCVENEDWLLRLDSNQQRSG
jgi:hypothetical protein